MIWSSAKYFRYISIFNIINSYHCTFTRDFQFHLCIIEYAFQTGNFSFCDTLRNVQLSFQVIHDHCHLQQPLPNSRKMKKIDCCCNWALKVTKNKVKSKEWSNNIFSSTQQQRQLTDGNDELENDLFRVQVVFCMF